MADLTVDPDYLTSLAAQQEAASSSLQDACDSVSGLDSLVKATHGLACHAASDALAGPDGAVQALMDAATAMKECADALSKALTGVAATYDQASATLAQHVDNAMRGV